MDPRLAELPATRWDRLVAVLEDVDPEMVIDASHIIERERKANMTDLELFYILAMRYQEQDSAVLQQVLNLYVLISTWMDWLESCDERVYVKKGGRPSRRSAGSTRDRLARGFDGDTQHNRLHPTAASSVPVSLMPSRSGNADDFDGYGTENDSAMDTNTASPLTRSVTTVHCGTDCSAESLFPLLQQSQSLSQSLRYPPPPLQQRQQQAGRSPTAQSTATTKLSGNQLSDTKPNNRGGSRVNSVNSPLPAPTTSSAAGAGTLNSSVAGGGGKSFLANFNLPVNWKMEGSVNFLRDGKVLCELVEETMDLALKNDSIAGGNTLAADLVLSASELDLRFPSLADIDRLANRSNGFSSSATLDHLHNVTVTHAKARGRRSRTSRAILMMEKQGKVVVEVEKTVMTLNLLCERYLGWDLADFNGQRFLEMPSADRVLRPLNIDDSAMLYRLHWFAVALFKTVNDPAIVPLPPRVSFLLTGESPEARVDDTEENCELAILIATKCSCLPHNSKVNLIVVGGNVIQVSHPVARPQPLQFPCCIVDGEAFVYLAAQRSFTPLWCLLKQLLKQWDNTLWDFELSAMEQRAEQVLTLGNVPASTAPLSTIGSPLLTDYTTSTGRQRGSVTAAGTSQNSPPSATVSAVHRHSLVTLQQSPHTPQLQLQLHQQVSHPGLAGGGGDPVHVSGSSFCATGSTAFDLTIKNSTIRRNRGGGASVSAPPARGADTGSSRDASLTPLVPTHAAALNSRAVIGDGPTEAMKSTPFGGTSIVQGGRYTASSRLLPQGSLSSYSDCSATCELQATTVPMSVAVRAGRVAPVPLPPFQSVCSFVDPQPPATRKLVSPTSGESSLITLHAGASSLPGDAENPASRASGDVRAALGILSLSSVPSLGALHSIAEADRDTVTEKPPPTQQQRQGERTVGKNTEDDVENDDEEDEDVAPIASATLLAVQSQSNRVILGTPSQYYHDNNESFREENITPPHEEADSSSMDYYSEIIRVRNFSAAVVHESKSTGIAVCDHHFRVSGRPVGKGAFGAVYRALDLGTGVVVAVKQSRYSIDVDDQDNLNWREFQTWSMLPSHPNVITFHGASKEVDTHQLLLVLEFASGGSIVAMYHNYRPIPEHLFLQHARGIALGLKHLHDHNVIHGDMKPENVLTRSDGSVAISDFGCSRLTLRASEDESTTGSSRRNSALSNATEPSGNAVWQLFGTAAFMAPEVITNEPDFKSDVWAYTCTLLHLWLGKPPWAEVPDTAEMHDSIPLMFYIANHDDAMPFTQEQLVLAPRAVQRIALRAFEHDVEKRASMAEVLSILAQYAQ